jgi:hypothetical protein
LASSVFIGLSKIYLNVKTKLLTEELLFILQKRRTLRQTLQRQRDEQFAAIPIDMKGIPINTNDNGNGTMPKESHYPGKRLSYTEATGSKLYSPPSLPTTSCQPESRSVTINNPAYGEISQDDNLV